MAQPVARWVKKSEYGDWGFDKPNPNLVKVVIDLRPRRSQAKYNPQMVAGSSRMDQFLNTRQRAKTEEQKANYEKFRQENQPPGSSKREFHPFGNETGADRYFGGPIIDKNTLNWRETNYTRACGDIVGVEESGIPLPSNIRNIVKSVAVMSSENMTQTAIWVGPRLLLSTLHIRNWVAGEPSVEECELVRKTGVTFNVESEICSKLLSESSPKVQLIEFSPGNDIGLFKLQDSYPSMTEYLDPDWLVECDEAYRLSLENGRNVACIGYSGKISYEDGIEVMRQAAIQLQKTLPQFVTQSDQTNLDRITKPAMKSFAPGAVDKIEARNGIVRLGVSASLWKGSSGGPCVLLAGVGGGKIVGLVRGYDLISDPYNIVNGFPNGLRDFIKNSVGSSFM